MKKTWPADSVERRKVADLVPYARNARTHSQQQIAQLAASIGEWGWTMPVLIDPEGGVIAGHGRLLAAQSLGIEDVPCMVAEGWSEAQRRAYVIADNRLALEAGWDEGVLAGEFGELAAADFDLGLTGFSGAELADFLADKTEGLTDPDDAPDVQAEVVSAQGDVWIMGNHRLLCGSCTSADAIDAVLQGRKADLCLTDPPYGLGEKKSSGKNDYSKYEDSLENLVTLTAEWLPLAMSHSDVVVFSSGVTRQWLYPEPNWVICWFYGGGQLRSPWGFNCWQPFLCYGKDPSLRRGRGARPDAVDMNTPANAADLDHPCPKPVKLWEWLIDRLIFKANAVIFDPFTGSGTTLIAAERKGLSVAAVEIDEKYCDVAVRRWQDFTGKDACLESTGALFSDVEGERRKAAA